MHFNNIDKATGLSLDVLKLSRNTLLVHLRFLDLALSVFKYVPIVQYDFATDGENLCFDPMCILRRYKAEKEAVVRDYLHTVLHCVFRHMYVDPSLNREKWDFACDIAVENMITELGLKATQAKRQDRQSTFVETLKKEVPLLTAEKIYRYLCDKGSSLTGFAQERELFLADSHEIWYFPPDRQSSFSDDSQNDKTKQRQNDDQKNGNLDLGIQGQRDYSFAGSSCSEMEARWKKISERIQVDMETFAKEKGDKAGGLMQNLREVNREKYDYAAFLKKFAVMNEAMKVNDDEFDYIFYTYGLSLYKKMPLVEPLEYKEIKQIKEFVIAIDTSGSVQGDLVQTFIQKTYNILKSTESFATRINLHIIQCDAEIQESVKITSQTEFDEYLKHMKLKGFGGTDFRPVFECVDRMIAQKEFVNLKGLIYFTDGYGVSPAIKPDYEVAFVFVEDEYNVYKVPPWAIKLVLQKEEI